MEESPTEVEQLRVFSMAPRRDRAAAERALARIRAELGERAVGRFRLRPAHLPEACSTFEPLETLPAPRPGGVGTRPLVRRIFKRPLPLPPRPRRVRDDLWQPRDPEQGPIQQLIGPYVVSGGWWSQEQHRAYAFARTARGDLLWVFFERRRGRWFQHGLVD